jgi:hypothetical protein
LTGSGKSFLRRRDFKEGDKERLLDGLGGVAAVQQTPQILLLDPEEMPKGESYCESSIQSCKIKASNGKSGQISY